MERVKVTITIDDEVLSRIDGYAHKNGLSRSGAISVLCSQMIATNDGIEAIEGLKNALVSMDEMAIQFKTYNEHQIANRKVRRKKV